MRAKIVFFVIDRHNTLIQFTLTPPYGTASAIVPPAVSLSGASERACQAPAMPTGFVLCTQVYEFERDFMLRPVPPDSFFSLSHLRTAWPFRSV
jgi:hypothetical protein